MGRFLRCPTSRQSQLDIGWTEEHCARLDASATEDHSYIAEAAERARRGNTWVLVLDSSGPNGPMNQREDYQEAKRIKLTTDFILESKSECDQTNQFAWHDEGSERVDPKTGWRWYDTQAAASSSFFFLGWQPSSWWQSSSWSQTSKWW